MFWYSYEKNRPVSQNSVGICMFMQPMGSTFFIGESYTNLSLENYLVVWSN